MDVILYQMDIDFGDPESNLQKIREMLELVQPQPNTLLVVPELFLTGYHPESIEQTGEELGSGHYSSKIKKIVADHDINFYGSIAAKFGEKIYNTAILVDKSGILTSYKKSHLFGPMGEKDLFDAGRDVITYQLGDYHLGFSICYDLRFPGLYQEQANRGVEISLICAEWPITRVDHWRSLTKARAIEHQQFVIAVNRVGKDPDYTYGGHSVVFSPTGKQIAGMDHAEEAIVETKIDLQSIKEFRNLFDVREDKWI